MIGQPRTVHVPYTLERDEDGVWNAHAWLGSSGGANGNGATPDEAIARTTHGRPGVLPVLRSRRR
jgi:hypothetical protein